jgi:hypothetical protein
MPQKKDQKKELFPLRRFVISGLYDITYLSQLVQRKKLKAQKIGRNYFTCLEWLEEYFEKYACEEKWQVYQKASKKLNKVINNKYSVNLRKSPGFRAAVIIAAVFIILVFVQLVINYQINRQGQVAGVEEYIEMATSTEQ